MMKFHNFNLKFTELLSFSCGIVGVFILLITTNQYVSSNSLRLYFLKSDARIQLSNLDN